MTWIIIHIKLYLFDPSAAAPAIRARNAVEGERMFYALFLVGSGCAADRETLSVLFFHLTILALVGFQGRGFIEMVHPDFCRSLLLEPLIFQ